MHAKQSILKSIGYLIFLAMVCAFPFPSSAGSPGTAPATGKSCQALFDEAEVACFKEPFQMKWPGPVKPPAGNQDCTICKESLETSKRNVTMLDASAKKCETARTACTSQCKGEENASRGDPARANEHMIANGNRTTCDDAFKKYEAALRGQSKSYVENDKPVNECIAKHCKDDKPSAKKDPADSTASNGSQGGSGSGGSGGGGGGMGDMMKMLGPLAQMAMMMNQQEQPSPTPMPMMQQQQNQLASIAPTTPAGCTEGQFMNSQGVCQSPPTQVGGVGANPTVAGGGPLTPSGSSSSGDGYDSGGSPYQPIVAGGGNPMPGMEGPKGGGGGGLSLSGGSQPNNGFGGGNRAVGEGPQASGITAGGGGSGGGGGGGGGGGWNGGKSDSPGSRGFNIGFTNSNKDRLPASVKIFGKTVPMGRDGKTGAMGPPVWEKLGSTYKNEYMGNQFFNDP
jgi:hypothetical protein